MLFQQLAVGVLCVATCVLAGPTPAMFPRTTSEVLNQTASVTTVAVNPVAPLYELVERRLPRNYHHTFQFELDATLTGSNGSYDAYTVYKTTNGKVVVKGETVSALGRGLNEALRAAGGDIYWSHDTYNDLLLPEIPLTANLTGESWAKHRYFMNVVTFSYSTAFYNWNDWEYLLDWAFLKGVNLPLAIGGQEYIWREVYRDFGLSEAEIYSWFSGPAFQSWQRMGNIHGSWINSTTSRPVSSEWLDFQWALQLKTIARMREFGMTPVLPAFNGFAPIGLNKILGGPTFLNASNWEGFSTQYTNDTAVDATWSTWGTIQTAFLKKQSELYDGWTSHYYSIDLFNELKPYSLQASYLTNLTASVVSSLRAVDPESVWVQQGWLFVSDTVSWNASTIEPYLAGAKNDELLMLDLASEAIPAWNKTNSFYGKNWTFNVLHDYGQNQGLYGSLDHYTSEVIRAKGNSSTLVGTGITMEGMNQNEIVYELTMDFAWNTSVISPQDWTYEFIQRRYGLNYDTLSAGAAQAHAAWKNMVSTVYNNTNFAVQGVIKSPLELVPSDTGITGKTGHHPTLLTYQPLSLVSALDSLISAADAAPGLLDVYGFSYDLVDVSRQVFINLGIPLYNSLISTWNSTTTNTTTNIAAAGSKLTDLLTDLDALLATQDQFLLSNWIDGARSWSNNATEQAFLEYQARNQITIWGNPTAAGWPLDRYASKQWAGVFKEFYVPGWNLFTSYLEKTPYKSYNQTAFALELLAFENTWQYKTWGSSANETFSTVGTPITVIKALRSKWNSTIASVYA